MLIIHWCFQLLLRNQRPFSVSRVRLMSGCAGAGRGHGQAASPRWPLEIFHTIDIMLSLWTGVGQGAENLFHKFSLFLEFNLFCKFKLFHEFGEIRELRDRCSGTGWSIGSLGTEKNCIEYSLFCIFIIIIVTIIIIIVIIIIIIIIIITITIPSFVVLLNCLYLNPQVLLFVHSPPHPTG